MLNFKFRVTPHDDSVRLRDYRNDRHSIWFVHTAASPRTVSKIQSTLEFADWNCDVANYPQRSPKTGQ